MIMFVRQNLQPLSCHEHQLLRFIQRDSTRSGSVVEACTFDWGETSKVDLRVWAVVETTGIALGIAISTGPCDRVTVQRLSGSPPRCSRSRHLKPWWTPFPEWQFSLTPPCCGANPTVLSWLRCGRPGSVSSFPRFWLPKPASSRPFSAASAIMLSAHCDSTVFGMYLDGRDSVRKHTTLTSLNVNESTNSQCNIHCDIFPTFLLLFIIYTVWLMWFTYTEHYVEPQPYYIRDICRLRLFYITCSNRRRKLSFLKRDASSDLYRYPPNYALFSYSPVRRYLPAVKFALSEFEMETVFMIRLFYVIRFPEIENVTAFG